MQEKSSSRERFSHEYILYLSILLGAVLRFYKLGSQSIWGDESLTLLKYTSGDSFIEVWGKIWHAAIHPPLYFLIAHYWFLLGKSEFMLRFPSAVFGIASIPVMYVLANRLFGRSTARISAFMVAVSPINIWYSQEARMYSLQIFLCLLATLYFVKLWQDRQRKDGVLYVLFVVAALFTHMASLALVAAHAFFALAASLRSGKRFAAWAGVQALVLLAFSPWLFNMTSARSNNNKEVRIGYQHPSSLMDIGYGFFTLSVGYSVGPSVADLHETSGLKALKPHLPIVAVTGLAFGLLMLFGIAFARKSNHWAMWFLLSSLLIPAGLAGLASLLPGIPLNPRYMMVSVIPYWLFMALGIQYASQRKFLLIVPGLVIVLTGLAAYNYYFQPKYWKQDVRSAMAVVNRDARPRDAIIVSSIELGGPFNYYRNRTNIPYYGYPSEPGLVDAKRINKDLSALTSNKDRVWLILGRTWSSDPSGLIRAHFDRHAALYASHSYPGVQLLCYKMP